MLEQIGGEVIFKVGQHNLSELQTFMKEPDNYCYARNTILAALTQLALHKKDRRTEVVEWFDELFHFFLENTEDDGIIDTDLISFMVGDCIDLRAAELEERVRNLYDYNLVEPGVAGTVEEVLQDMKSGLYSSRKYEIDNIFSRYDYLVDLWYPEANQSIFDTYLQKNKGTQLFGRQEPFVSEEVGRNDPCPCGSGKKYKYCCMR